MTQLLFYGCLFVGFSPILAFYAMVVCRNSQLIILSIGGSFFWLLSMLVASIWWYIIPPMRTSFWFIIPFSIAIQEAFRYLFYRLYAWGFNNRPSLSQVQSQLQKQLKEKSINSSDQSETELQQQQQSSQQPNHQDINTRLETLSARPNHTLSSAAIGCGSGITYAFVMYGTIMWDSQGPGNLFSAACPTVSLFMISAILALCISLLHIAWNVIAFQGFRSKKYYLVAFVIICHYLISYLTLLNIKKSCEGSVVSIGIITILTIAFCFRTLLNSDSISKKVD
ncbi:gamma-secretase subunit Aph-1 [Cavenderia fasciculata]|uniref:Gamma-secretase subunit Aph-1 n=1 Tax=Cavenderia fasciculata TaxID=261658 RepID=F4PV32_CACFS|nr:gamma-secretase subunit Aph-1 [Cavenderia fasciculata]EGG21148.1 gamma-secretase subunit Aph-1 [Cavenderia fasciculata]|eukprot:XP_004358998.1 gamma-secretase subunit Aph-1 [Cavenderia fasciculata]